MGVGDDHFAHDEFQEGAGREAGAEAGRELVFVRGVDWARRRSCARLGGLGHYVDIEVAEG